MRESRKDHLIDTALRLFNQDGYHATGIDKILDVAGVAKMTLYKHFRSKEDLIAAVLDRRADYFATKFVEGSEGKDLSARDQILLIRDIHADWFRSGDFAGCMFMNALSEYALPGQKIHDQAVAHKQAQLDNFTKLFREMGHAEPENSARQLMMIFDGAINSVRMFGAKKTIAAMQTMVSELIH